MISRPPPSLLERVLPKVNSLPKPFVILVARFKILSRDQSFSRCLISPVKTDHRPMIIGIIENLGWQEHDPLRLSPSLNLGYHLFDNSAGALARYKREVRQFLEDYSSVDHIPIQTSFRGLVAKL